MAYAQYFNRSQDPYVPGCAVSGLEGEDGVMVPSLNLEDRTHCFIGRTALYDLFAAYLDITPDEIEHRLVKNDTTELQARLDEMQAKLDKYNAFFDKASEAGLIIPVLE